MAEQKHKLYSTALCISGREALAPINGREVSVIGYRNAGDLGSVYTVTHESKSPRSFECFERELRSVLSPINRDCDDPYAVIRNMLGCYLHQDFDLQYDSVADALQAAIRQTDIDWNTSLNRPTATSPLDSHLTELLQKLRVSKFP